MDEVAKVEGCEECEAHKDDALYPLHIPSIYCESGSHPHCTCDWCF